MHDVNWIVFCLLDLLAMRVDEDACLSMSGNGQGHLLTICVGVTAGHDFHLIGL